MLILLSQSEHCLETLGGAAKPTLEAHPQNISQYKRQSLEKMLILQYEFFTSYVHATTTKSQGNRTFKYLTVAYIYLKYSLIPQRACVLQNRNDSLEFNTSHQRKTV